jgi:cytochrome c oxidase cbb3-type subunit 3
MTPMSALWRRWVRLGCLLACLLGCQREVRQFDEATPQRSAAAPLASDFYPGPLPRMGHGSPTALQPWTQGEIDESVQETAWSVSQGKRLFTWFNCTGCHAHGGGGIGPPLMDAYWRYGSDLRSVVTSIAQGRPNGMPAYGGKATHGQLLQLGAYVRSLAGLVPMSVASGRDDSMNFKNPEAMMPGQIQSVEVRR